MNPLDVALGPCIHIVDDEVAIRHALAFLMQSHDMPFAVYEDGEVFLRKLDAQPLMRGVVLLDVRMSPVSGLEVHDQLIARHCRMPVIFLSGHGDIPMAVRAVNNGALDFIEKPFDPDGLLRRLSKALGLEADRHQLQQAQSQLRTVILGLSDRELSVMRMVALGKLNKVIANELGISMRTVEVHRAKVYEKLGVRSGAEVATLLVQFESV